MCFYIKLSAATSHTEFAIGSSDLERDANIGARNDLAPVQNRLSLVKIWSWD